MKTILVFVLTFISTVAMASECDLYEQGQSRSSARTEILYGVSLENCVNYAQSRLGQNLYPNGVEAQCDKVMKVTYDYTTETLGVSSTMYFQ